MKHTQMILENYPTKNLSIVLASKKHDASQGSHIGRRTWFPWMSVQKIHVGRANKGRSLGKEELIGLVHGLGREVMKPIKR